MIAYPSFLPNPLVTYGFDNQNATVTSTFESGRVSQRARSTRQRDIAKVVFNFTFLELGIWEGFVQNSINNGAIEFEINLPNPATGAIEERTALLSGGVYSAQAIAGAEKWSVSCTLILQTKPTVSGELIGLLGIFEGNGDELIAWSSFFHEIVNEILPDNI